MIKDGYSNSNIFRIQMSVESHSNDNRWIFEHEYPSNTNVCRISLKWQQMDIQTRISFEYECLSNLTQMITDGYSNMNIFQIRMSVESHSNDNRWIFEPEYP
jgi:hypothetical protein